MSYYLLQQLTIVHDRAISVKLSNFLTNKAHCVMSPSGEFNAVGMYSGYAVESLPDHILDKINAFRQVG